MGLLHKVGWDPGFMARSAWFWPLEGVARRLEALEDWPDTAVFEALYAEGASASELAPLRFADNVRKQDKRAAGRVVLDALYDARIAVHGEVPTRERDWHDLFNALCFATFPRIKHALHARQYQALQRRIGESADALPPARTREQDALTLFDEGGVVVAARPALATRLEQAGDDLGAALLEHAGDPELSVVPVGHALFEHLVEGLMLPGARACVLPLDPWPRGRAALLEAVDREFARVLSDPGRFVSPREQVHLRLAALDPRQYG